MRALITHCLVCTGPVTVERVRCQRCQSALEGQFSLDWLAGLTPEQLQFIRVFVTSHGKIKEVEQVLGISYPTVVSRLDDIVNAINRKPAAERAAAPAVAPAAVSTDDVIDRLARGELTVDEAEALLGKGGR